MPGPRARGRSRRDQQARLHRRRAARGQLSRHHDRRFAGWRDCSLYGARTYTCDSQAFAASGQAETALAALVAEVKECLGEDWSKDDSRSSPVYVVVRNERDAVSMTLSTDQADDGGHVVRLTLFVRGR